MLRCTLFEDCHQALVHCSYRFVVTLQVLYIQFFRINCSCLLLEGDLTTKFIAKMAELIAKRFMCEACTAHRLRMRIIACSAIGHSRVLGKNRKDKTQGFS